MEDKPKGQSGGPGRGKRAIAFVLSLIQPGAGQFLFGSFRRGVIWAVGVAGIGLACLFLLPVGLLAITLALTVSIVGHVASAVDTVTLTAGRPRWALVLAGWGALIVGGLVIDPLKDNYSDYILVDKSVYRAQDPQRGDIIVFKYPQDERRDFIKRIVGTPGDVVAVRGRQVVVNGKLVDEPYVRRVDSALGRAGDTTFCGYAYGCDPTTVPADSYFVMGDNRDNSQDSRYWGFVKKDKIKGKAFTIYWSWDGDRHWFRWWRLGRSIS